MADYQIPEGVYEKLSEATYLHNHYLNFLIVTNNLKGKTGANLNWGKRLNNILDDLIRNCEDREEKFYKAFKVSGRKEWEEKYLITDIEPYTINNIVGRTINSRKFASILEEEYKKAMEEIVKEEIINRKKGEQITTDFLRDSLKGFTYTFESAFAKISAVGIGPQGEKRSQDDLKEAVKARLIRNIIDARRRPIKYLIKEFEKQGLNESDIKKYIANFKNTVASSIDNSSFSSVSGSTGAILEILLPTLFGDEWENKANITKDGKKIGTDTIVRLGNGLEYRLQLKNSFNGVFNIKIKEQFSYKEFIEKIALYQPELVNELNYLVGNIAFFNKTQTKRNGKTTIVPTFANAGGATEYLRYIFNAITTLFFTETLTTSNMNAAIFQRTTNDFFIYRGRYLIPLSSFFKSTKDILNKGLSNDTLGLVTLPSLNELTSQTSEDARKLLNEKRKALKFLRRENIAKNQDDIIEYFYPDNIIDQGRGKAANIAMGVTGNSFYFNFHKTNFENMLTQYD